MCFYSNSSFTETCKYIQCFYFKRNTFDLKVNGQRALGLNMTASNMALLFNIMASNISMLLLKKRF